MALVKNPTPGTTLGGVKVKYVIILEPGPNNWGAFSPNVPGCVATGQTPQETLSQFLEALDFHLESLQLDGDPIPADYDGDAEDIDYDSDYVYFRMAPVDTTPRASRENSLQSPVDPNFAEAKSVDTP